MRIPDYESAGNGEKFNISPSSLSQFIENPRGWYNRYLAKTDSFKGNTNTIFGTIIHAGIEQYFKGEQLTSEDVRDYINRQMCELDVNFIMNHWGETLDVVKPEIQKPDLLEHKTTIDLGDITIGGTIDYIRGDTVGDYKTCDTLKKDFGQHNEQVLAYVYCERLNGRIINHREITYIQKPNEGKISEKTGKLIGVKKPMVNIVRVPVTSDDMEYIERLIKTIEKTLEVRESGLVPDEILFRENVYSYRK